MRIKVDLALVTKVSLFTAIFFLPLKTTISNIGILGMIGTSLIAIFRCGIQKTVVKDRKFYFYSTVILYTPLIFAIFYAPDFSNAYDELERGVFLVAAPLLLLRKDINREEIINVVIWGLLIGSVLCMLYLHIINLNNFLAEVGESSILSYKFTSNRFVAPLIDMHPVYLGSYFLMLIILVKENKQLLKNYIAFPVILLTVTTIVFLASRIIILSLFVLFIVYILTNVNFKQKLVTGILTLLAVLVMFPMIKDTYFYNKLVEGSKWELTNNVGNANIDKKKKSDSRMSRWIISYDIISKKPLFGYGTGTEQQLLLNAYVDSGMKVSEHQKYNAHNQFLGYGLQFGLMGVFLMLMYFGINFKLGYNALDYLSMGYCIILFCCCLTENYLARNMGVNFVAIFGTVLHLKNRNT